MAAVLAAAGAVDPAPDAPLAHRLAQCLRRPGGLARLRVPRRESVGTLGPGVTAYNIAPISLGAKAVVSQHANLCTGTHDHRHPAFPLYARPIHVGSRAWICAHAFVGPGVTVGDGAVLAACGVAFSHMAPWTVYRGNPAQVHSQRAPIHE